MPIMRSQTARKYLREAYAGRKERYFDMASKCPLEGWGRRRLVLPLTSTERLCLLGFAFQLIVDPKDRLVLFFFGFDLQLNFLSPQPTTILLNMLSSLTLGFLRLGHQYPFC
jgi:hypothetical protein